MESIFILSFVVFGQFSFCQDKLASFKNAVPYIPSASQSDSLFGDSAHLAVDGDKKTCMKVLAKKHELAWWRAYLGDVYDISDISIFYDPQKKESQTLNNFDVYLSTDELNMRQRRCASFGNMTDISVGSLNFTCKKPIPGMFVAIVKKRGSNSRMLAFCELYVSGPGMTNTSCDSKHFRCGSRQTCLPKKYICDKIMHCPDGSDEVNCVCRESEYQCRQSKCITKSWICDGVRDCQDGDDEIYCVNCNKEEFKCTTNNICIKLVKRCDGVLDCPDDSDERGCLELSEVTRNMGTSFLMATFKGETEFYFCSTAWPSIVSSYACRYMGFKLEALTDFMSVYYTKVLGWTGSKTSDLELDSQYAFMSFFEEAFSIFGIF